MRRKSSSGYPVTWKYVYFRTKVRKYESTFVLSKVRKYESIFESTKVRKYSTVSSYESITSVQYTCCTCTAVSVGPRARRTVSESYHRSRVSRTPRPRIAPVAGRSVVERKSRGCVGNRSSGSRSPPGSRRITARTSTARVSTSRARLSSSLAMLLRSTARAFS